MPSPASNDVDATRAAVALGSNRGRRLDALELAVRRLSDLLEGLRCSSPYETEPLDVRGQRRFLNLCCVGVTSLAPDRLLGRLLAVEEEAGRRREPGAPPGPRRLDLDLLLYGDVTVEEPGLCVPHPRMTERAFVLVPLSDVAPEWRHPEEGRTIRELAREVSDRGVRLWSGPLPEGLRGCVERGEDSR